MNPARSIGPALVGGDLHALWLYIVAPLSGAALGALTYQFVRSEPTSLAQVPSSLESEPEKELA
jgi:aquaporin NIP